MKAVERIRMANMPFDKFENEFSNDDIKSLSAYLASEDGQEAYKDLIKKNPL